MTFSENLFADVMFDVHEISKMAEENHKKIFLSKSVNHRQDKDIYQEQNLLKHAY